MLIAILIYCICGAINMYFGYKYMDKVIGMSPALQDLRDDDEKNFDIMYGATMFVTWPLSIAAIFTGLFR